MQLTSEQISIIDTCRVAIVCTNGDDGHPQVTATWFERNGQTILFSIAESSTKARNIARDPNGTLFFIDPGSSLRTVEIRGSFVTSPDPDLADAKRIGARMGDDLTRYVAPGEGRITVSIEPAHIAHFAVG